ncbi:conserved hypothetical protein [Methanococcus vannielii SB]|uniref:Signal transduction histidine kinase, LytS n=1 Tax=Methanococcus vannielii (strain ATCC 35089 / DSM 1224 / JCM 13029 / OCM 148 / SB) TaxID=406327 RepID=A6UR93_METVS|nr:energy-coupling factor ABC transporter permease [Methanococcus vannielii]ABR55015.1 conserved hypothetical protein [Methanococcus vannielii SB]
MDNSKIFFAVFFGSIILNVIGAYIESLYLLPIYMDSTGTILSAILLGPHIGAIVGLITNLLNGYLLHSEHILFVGVNILIGVITGQMLYKKDITAKLMLKTILMVTFVASILGNFISIAFFGGVTEGGVGFFTNALTKFVENIPTAAFYSGICTNTLDKLLSFAIVFEIIYLFKKPLTPLGVKI